jgi:hypothetical protein
LDEHAYVVYSSQPDISYSEYLASQDKKWSGKSSALGGFFGHLNRVTEWTMELLIKKGFYREYDFYDHFFKSILIRYIKILPTISRILFRFDSGFVISGHL